MGNMIQYEIFDETQNNGHFQLNVSEGNIENTTTPSLSFSMWAFYQDNNTL